MRNIRLVSIAFPLILIIFLVGCSKEISFEDEIVKILESDEGKDYERVIDYDIRGDYIVVIYKSKKNQQLNIGFIKMNDGKLNWEVGIGGPELIGGDAFISDPLYVNVMIPNESNIKHVKVFGEYAKQVKYSNEIKYWILYTNKSPNSLDVEYIK
ncbi:hypothetical protein CD30_07425 [Ureibacillus massiliensis 4400831 = CIP 108448 = CCUG 49529]|uniref:Lipoprotein n=1 Tax=Ureibacillus massiliensis 4400831 = CIP 108448 = CCUG 49529 TaxID=1211035 RepID=A0A0A3J2W2_9BACL|nr:hypothetical protein [Ureibacillus massiliensis]KGR91261.1 hypothetical protein CD30_07425 [Ureibacillus massiliensis 4400831 = CIP 108448 = CCUG 49529]